MSAGLSNQAMLRIPVATKGLDTSCLSVTNFLFNTAGTATISNITSAKVFYTGSLATFAAVNQLALLWLVQVVLSQLLVLKSIKSWWCLHWKQYC